MKKLLLICFFYLTCDVNGQIKVGTTWYTYSRQRLGTIKFNKNEVLFDFTGVVDSKKYHMSKDTLIMVDDYTTSRDNFAKRHIDEYKFLTDFADHKTLTLVPLNNRAKELSDNLSLEFRDIDNSLDSDVKFSRLHFKTQIYAAEFSIDIDNKGNFYLKGTGYADPYRGYFKGKLTVPQLDTLNYLLQHSEIKKMHTWKQIGHVMDTPPFILTLYYGDKKLRVQTNKPPLNMFDLKDFLDSTYQKGAVIRDPKKRQFDEDAEPLNKEDGK